MIDYGINNFCPIFHVGDPVTIVSTFLGGDDSYTFTKIVKINKTTYKVEKGQLYNKRTLEVRAPSGRWSGRDYLTRTTKKQKEEVAKRNYIHFFSNFDFKKLKLETFRELYKIVKPNTGE